MNKDEQLDTLSKQVNRSYNQTLFLYKLLNEDFNRLQKLEIQIKNCHIAYCPDTMDDVVHIENLVPKTTWFNLK